MLTSTRRIGAWPDHERPLRTILRPAGSVASHASSINMIDKVHNHQPRGV
jgi:hypothetical protein